MNRADGRQVRHGLVREERDLEGTRREPLQAAREEGRPGEGGADAPDCGGGLQGELRAPQEALRDVSDLTSLHKTKSTVVPTVDFVLFRFVISLTSLRASFCRASFSLNPCSLRSSASPPPSPFRADLLHELLEARMGWVGGESAAPSAGRNAPSRQARVAEAQRAEPVGGASRRARPRQFCRGLASLNWPRFRA